MFESKVYVLFSSRSWCANGFGGKQMNDSDLESPHSAMHCVLHSISDVFGYNIKLASDFSKEFDLGFKFLNENS